MGKINSNKYQAGEKANFNSAVVEIFAVDGFSKSKDESFYRVSYGIGSFTVYESELTKCD